MEKIRTQFVKNKLKGLKFTAKNSAYIDSLIYLERGVLGEIRGVNGNVVLHSFQTKYPKEYNAIEMELDPGAYKRRIEKEKKEKREDKEWDMKAKKEEREYLKDEKKWWVKNGGKL